MDIFQLGWDTYRIRRRYGKVNLEFGINQRGAGYIASELCPSKTARSSDTNKSHAPDMQLWLFAHSREAPVAREMVRSRVCQMSEQRGSETMW
jgi:hypothetical protein